MTPAEQVKSRLDVVTLIQSYIKLDKAGQNYKARCPFHSERSPSFFVSPARDIWHCFGCSKGGDIFKFVMEMDGVDFPDALRTLAERAGVELRAGSTGARSEKAKLLALTEDAAKFFEENLSSNQSAREYLGQRDVNEESIKEFRIGFAPDSWRALGDHLKRKGYTDEEIAKAGLSVQGSHGPYDRFRSRIIFPLEDALGRVIGFGGRIFPVEVRPLAGEVEPLERGGKYINSPQTALYDKSRYLYGLSKAKGDIRQQKNVVVVEGYMDCILSHQAGVKNTVAVSGTALTEVHLTFLRRISERLTFAFDTDSAGLEAARRAVALAYKHDLNVKLVDIEGGKDPADIVLLDASKWRTMIDAAKESVSFFLKKAIGDSTPRDPFSKKKIGDEILPLVSRISNEIERAHWIRELSKILAIGEEALWRELDRHKDSLNSTETNYTATAQMPAATRKMRLEERLAGMILIDPRLALLGELPEAPDCSVPAAGVLFEYLRGAQQNGILPNELFSILSDDLRREADRFAFEAEVFKSEESSCEDEFLNLLHSWREIALRSKLVRLRSEIERYDAEGNREESRKTLEEFRSLTAHLAHTMNQYDKDKKEKKENR